MTQPMILRVILGEDDARKIVLPAGRPDSVEELIKTLKLNFGLDQDFRLQYQDADFGMEFVNLSVIAEIDNKATVKGGLFTEFFCRRINYAPARTC